MKKLIALDWGTSSFRAYLCNEKGQIEDIVLADTGIMRVEGGAFEEVLYSQIGHWLIAHPNSAIIASGMITSKQGWVETPYITCPVGFATIADKLVEHTTSQNHKVSFVSGVNQTTPSFDIMRGEETQIAGLMSGDDIVVILPGTHSKWIRVQDDKIAQFSTFMTGEIFATICNHTILGKLITPGESEAAFSRGVKVGFSKETGILSSLFSGRVLPLLGEMESSEIKDYLSGLMLGTEIKEAMATGFSIATKPVVGASDMLTQKYTKALQLCGFEAVSADSDLAAKGLFKIAQQAQLI